MLQLERPAVKETAASRHPAHCELRGRSSCFGHNNEIFNAVPQQKNGGWRATAVDVPAALGTPSTPPPTPSPLIIYALSVQAFGAAEGLADRVGRGEGPMSRQEKELYYLARTIGRPGEVLHRVKNEQASPQLLCLRAAPSGPTAAAGRRASPAAPAVARWCSAIRPRTFGGMSGSVGCLAPSRL